MNTNESFETQLYGVNESSFENIALTIFKYQAEHNPIYREYLRLLGTDIQSVQSINTIPYLPISFFKRHKIKSGQWEEETFFASSGTTGAVRSIHNVRDFRFYLSHSERCFKHFFGNLSDYHFLALLPSYLERENSSLIAMMEHFISRSGSNDSGFFLYDIDRLLAKIRDLQNDTNRRILLWGVSFALLDLADSSKLDLSECLIFETGGMKGRRREILRTELHEILHDRLSAKQIFSEYGMTELLSQAYTKGKERFHSTPWMRIIGREISDPLNVGIVGETAALNVIDLANWNTISFIETEDLGKVFSDGTFEVLGRMDNSEMRGCNLMIE